MSRAEDVHIDMSRSDMPHAARIVSSYVARVVNSERRLALRNAALERVRRLRGAPHRVVYYHEVDDPYSHLAAQALLPLCEQYEIEIECRVTAPEGGMNRPEPERLLAWARTDCALVAPHYGLTFPEHAPAPDAELVARGERVLAARET